MSGASPGCVCPKHKTGMEIPFSRSWTPSGIVATANQSTPQACNFCAHRIIPCPYALALTTARNFADVLRRLRRMFTLLAKSSRLISAQVRDNASSSSFMLVCLLWIVGGYYIFTRRNLTPVCPVAIFLSAHNTTDQPDYVSQNLRQQSGFSAEVLDTARRNSAAVINGEAAIDVAYDTGTGAAFGYVSN